MSVLSIFGLQRIPEAQAAEVKTLEGNPLHLQLDYSSKEGLIRLVSRVIHLKLALKQKGHTKEQIQGYKDSIAEKRALLAANKIAMPEDLGELQVLLEGLTDGA